MKKLKWEVPKLVDLSRSANGAIAGCTGGSEATGDCNPGGRAIGACTGGGEGH